MKRMNGRCICEGTVEWVQSVAEKCNGEKCKTYKISYRYNVEKSAWEHVVSFLPLN